MNILVTGAGGFIGKNLVAQLQKRTTHTVIPYDRSAPATEQASLIGSADLVFHLAGVNRPLDEKDFASGNADFTRDLCSQLAARGRPIPIIFASSIQALENNPYGLSKLEAERMIQAYAAKTGSRIAIYRLPNVFGKWSQPNYNSVVATFCHNIARDLPITISDPQRILTLAYIDDVVAAFVAEIERESDSDDPFREISPLYEISLSELAERIRHFRQIRSTLHLPELSEPLSRNLYATYLSFLDVNDLAYSLDQKVDARGSLAEFIKGAPFGQIFVSRTVPGITRGNHFHHTKTEKFLVLEGEAVIAFQHLLSGEIIKYRVRGSDYRVLDIPPGYSHSIENVGTTELVTLFWASEIFEPERPDTYFEPVGESAV